MTFQQTRQFVVKTITERRARRKRDYIKRQFARVRTTEGFITNLVSVTSEADIMAIARLVGYKGEDFL